MGAQRVIDGLAGFKGGSEHACIGADWQRVGVVIEAACECHYWLSGYYNGKRNTTTVDVEQLKETARTVESVTAIK